MPMVRQTQRVETFEQWRARMLEETGRFIAWGLKHPEEVQWIAKHPVGGGGFSERLKRVFWRMVVEDEQWGEER
jgi:hypothetical protein